MAYVPKVVTPPAVEPVTSDEVKGACRIDGTDEDTNITRWIAGARELVEAYADRALVNRTLRWTQDYFPLAVYGVPSEVRDDWDLRRVWETRRLNLPRPPLVSVTSIKYDDANGIEQTLDPTLYRVVADCEPGTIEPAYGQIWPVTRWQKGAVRIVFVAGYGADATNVPARAKQAILMQVGFWYRDRGDGGEVRMTEDLHPAVKALLACIWTGTYG